MAISRGAAAIGRRFVLASAVLWSLSGVVTKGLDLDAGSIAFYRSLFAGLAILCFVRPIKWVFRPVFVPFCVVFATMIGVYIASIQATTAANAIFLQCTSTFWVVPLGLVFLREQPDRRAIFGICLAMLGVVAIVGFGYDGRPGEGRGIVLALASGVCYAIVAIIMRSLRDLDPLWISAVGNLGGALVLGGWFVATGTPIAVPTLGQGLTLAAFGVLQMAIPYALFARGLHAIDAAEAGLIGLLEPVLNPIWVFLFHGERPAFATLIGGGFLLAGVALRYVPTARAMPVSADPPEPIEDEDEGYLTVATAGGGVERGLTEVGQGVVMHERRGRPGEEVGVVGHIKVEHRLDLIRLDRRHLAHPAQGPDRVTDLEVPRHDPAVPGLPEPVRRAGDDRVVAERDPERRAGRVVVGHHHRPVGEPPVPRILRKDAITDV